MTVFGDIGVCLLLVLLTIGRECCLISCGDENCDTLPWLRLKGFCSVFFRKVSYSGVDCKGIFDGGVAATLRILALCGLNGFTPLRLLEWTVVLSGSTARPK